MLPNSSDALHRITDALTQSLEQAFEEVCPQRYDAPLRLQRVDDGSTPQRMTFELGGPDGVALQIHVAVRHVGGNVYDVNTQVEEGTVHRFTYSEPASSESSLSIAPHLGQKIANHVLDEVEQRLGRELLRRRTGSPI